MLQLGAVTRISFPKGQRLIHYNDEITDVVLVTDGVAIKQNQEFINKIELANFRKGSNVVIVTHFEILDQRPAYKNHKETRKNRRRFAMYKIGHQHPESVTNTFGLQHPSPTSM